MKKLCFLALLLLLLCACDKGPPPHPFIENLMAVTGQDEEYYNMVVDDIQDILPSDWIPTHDRKLLRAYLNLFRAEEPVQWGFDGEHTISGVELGLWIAENEVSIHWDTYETKPTESGLCGTSNACTTIIHENAVFIHEPRRMSSNVVDITGSLAHEVFHLFNDWEDKSKFEEVMAYWIQYNVTGQLLDGDYSRRDAMFFADPTVRYEPEAILAYLDGRYADYPMYPMAAISTKHGPDS